MSGELPREVLLDVYRHAREAFPAECCGFLVGEGALIERARRCRNAQTDGEHPVAAQRGAETAYVIAGEDLLTFVRAVDDGTAKVLYHSHPNGRAYFSATDTEVALGGWDEPAYPVLQLVVGIDAERVVEAKLFAWDGKSFAEVARFDGAAL
jgi:[CysO sulfur-carrier protein]-S-L-cysteine hydrolase